MQFNSRQAAAAGTPEQQLKAQNAGPRMPPTAAQEKAAARAGVQQSRVGQTFAQIVTVLMRDPVYRNLKIADLEHLVLPPILAGQFQLAMGTRKSDADKEQKGGIYLPVAVALWARVSPAVDKALSGNLDKQVWLRPNEWTSGEIIWLMAAAGHPRAVPEFLKQLAEKQFSGKQVRMRLRDAEGKTVIRTMGQQA